MRDVKQRITMLRERAGLKPTELARALGVSRGAVYHWEDVDSRSMPTIENLLALSAVLGCSVSDLLGQRVETTVDGSPPPGSVPLIEPADADSPGFLDDLRIPSTSRKYMPCPVEHGPRTFAMEIVGDANVSLSGDSYAAGEIAYFDPDVEHVTDSMVLARLPSGRAVVRRLVDDAAALALLPLNDRYQRVDMPFQVVAVLIASVKTPTRRQ